MSTFITLELAKQFARDCQSIKTNKIIRDQLDRASLSVALNLSEGSAKTSRADRNRFYQIALGSFRECETILDIIRFENKEIMELKSKLAGHLTNLCKATR